MQLNAYELDLIVGGAISGTLLNSIIKGITILIELGRALGTAIKRSVTNSSCKV